MLQNRMHFDGMYPSPYQDPAHWYFIVAQNTTEVLTSTGWKVIGPPLPKNVGVPCLMRINETSFLMQVGEITNGELYPRETFIFNAETNTWTSGPPLQTGRRCGGCGLIKENANSNNNIFITAGGYNAWRSTEILTSVDSMWEPGKYVVITYHYLYIGYFHKYRAKEKQHTCVHDTF
jgi:hypothetical protein